MRQIDELFSHKSGIPNHGPCMLLTANLIDIKLHCCVTLGTYYQVNDKPNPSNTNNPRITGAISLYSQGNLQDEYNVLTLYTWKVVQHRK